MKPLLSREREPVKLLTANELLGPTPDRPYIDIVLNHTMPKNHGQGTTELTHYE